MLAKLLPKDAFSSSKMYKHEFSATALLRTPLESTQRSHRPLGRLKVLLLSEEREKPTFKGMEGEGKKEEEESE